jgi:hypothetical protein
MVIYFLDRVPSWHREGLAMVANAFCMCITGLTIMGRILQRRMCLVQD